MKKMHGLMAVLVVLWTGAAARAYSAVGIDVVVTNTVNFSQLDGGPLDGDGMDDGEFTCTSLTVSGTGAIILDVNTAEFTVCGDVVLQNSGAIRTPSIVTKDEGPSVKFEIGRSFYMSGTSLLRSHGKWFGGSIEVITAEDIKLTQSAKIEAHSTAGGSGGLITLSAGDSLRLGNSTNRVTANGFTGGTVKLYSSEEACLTIYINAVVNAVGFNGEGGVISIIAEKGGVAIVGEPYRIAASGTLGPPGSVYIYADKMVTPDPVLTQPAALVVENGEPCPP